MKLTEDERNWLSYLATEPSGLSHGYEALRQKCRRAGWTVWNRSTQRWVILPAGRAALKEMETSDD